MSAPDKLYYARNAFFLGDFEKCIETCNQLRVSTDAENLEKSYFIYRAMICLGKYEEVIDQIDNSPIKTVELNAIRILASYFAFPDKKEESVKAISLLLNEELGNTSLVRIIACTIFNNENDFEHAYLTVQNAETIEELSVLVYTLVRMNRFDLASDIYKKMQKIDDDHVLSQLASTWIESNGDQNAMDRTATTYDDLLRNNHSTMLINNHTIAKLRLCASQNKMDDLEVYYSTLKNEYENNSHDETLLHNLIVVSSLYHRDDEEVEKYLKELEVLNPSNVLVTTVKNMSSRVEQLEKEFM